MADPVISAKDIVRKFNGRKPVLDGVTFDVLEKEFVVVQGKSGCGKTTLLNIIGGLDRPTSGDVFIDGESLAELSEDGLARLRLDKIGFVFQDYNLLADLTVRENVALPLKFSRKKDTGRVDELLGKFDIKHLSDETANKISGGEAQRTAIARAMMNEPRIILADEPTGNLDSENAAIVLNTFQLVRRDFGTTVVMATHDRELGRGSSKRIRLDDGRATVEDS
jgi:putative ABC transport system ATP-binding protein